MKQHPFGLLALLGLLLWPQFSFSDETIKLGISVSMSGSFANVGANTKNGAELALHEINAAGLEIAGKKYSLEFAYVDNASNRSTACNNAIKLITQEKILALVGPQSSDRAIAVGEIANSFKIPMITPLSTSPLTTLNRPYVFRLAVLYDIQALATTKFAAKEWKGTKAAVLYDEISPYPSGMAKAFKKIFEEANGEGSVVAFESFRTGETDFSKQLQAIAASAADFLYIPQHDEEVPIIIKQARKMAWKKPITGSNSWSIGDLMSTCGDDCKGLFFTGNFAAGGAKGKAREFVDKYQKTYNKPPDEAAALTYDTIRLIAQALRDTGGLTGNLLEDRNTLRKQIAAVKNFEGLSGRLGYQGNGDPAKCAVLIEIDQNGLFTTHDTVCP